MFSTNLYIDPSKRRSGLGRRLAFLAAAALLIFAVSSCAGQYSPLPTLVPTLALVIPPTLTASASPTQVTATATVTAPAAMASQTEEGTVTPDLPPTETITPWAADTATPGPSPTGTRTPTATKIPTRTQIPTRTPTITLTPTITFTPTPPPPSIELMRPGLLSKVLSPIQMEMYAVTGADGKVNIELVGEDGRIISRQVLDYSSKPGRRVWAAPEVAFEISAAAEIARLQVSAQDEFGRVESLSSVDLILLSEGRNEINPPAITQDPYLIRQPEEDAPVNGGLLVLSGLARPVNASPLLIELVSETGSVLQIKQLVVPTPSGPLSHTPFTVEIPYKIFSTMPVRLVIRQEGSRIPGTVALSSETILLNP